MTVVAFIPARSTSWRFPAKNLSRFRGLPLVACAIRVAVAARQARVVDDVVVSTDSAAVAAAAAQAGACTVAGRPPEVAARGARVVDVLRCWLRDQPEPPELVCVLLPTSPLRRLRHVVEARGLLSPQVDVVLSVTPFRQDPQHALVLADGLLTVSGVPDARPRWRHDGTVIWVRTAHLLAGRGFYDGTLAGYPVPSEDSVDVDTPLDLAWAEFLAGRAPKD